jgi:hypothetical protein
MRARLLRFDIRRAGRTLLIVFGGLVVVNLVFYVLMTRPQMNEFDALNTKSSPQIEALKKYEAAVTAKEEFLLALQKAQSDLEFLKTDVLSTRPRRMISVQAELEQLTNSFQINLEQVQYENENLPEEGLVRFAMVVPLQGGYQNLRNFLSAVEESDKFLVIERVALGTGPEGGVILQLNITLATYFELPQGQMRASTGGRA